MKKTLTLFIGVFLIAGSSFAQITIEKSNFEREASFSDEYRLPTVTGTYDLYSGPDTSWDFSGVDQDNAEDKSLEHFDATSDPVFTDALNKYNGYSSFYGYLIPSTFYEAIDDNGWYLTGMTSRDTAYSISDITGGANDSLGFSAMEQIYDGRLNYIKFPMTYESFWNEERTEYMDLWLNFAAVGLNHAKGNRKRAVSQTREIIGYGKIRIPDDLNMPSDLFDVLLMDVQITYVDSFFLNGAPASETLLGGLGVSQGMKTTLHSYIYYTAGFASPVLSISLNENNEAIGWTYRYRAPEFAAVSDMDANLVQSSPNPVKAGAEITISSLNAGDLEGISILDIQGKSVYNYTTLPSSNSDFNLLIPGSLDAGIYFISITGKNNQVIGYQKIVVTP